jgi:hypothetical protein
LHDICIHMNIWWVMVRHSIICLIYLSYSEERGLCIMKWKWWLEEKVIVCLELLLWRSYVRTLFWVAGYDISVIAYGQSGSGKTYTILGPGLHCAFSETEYGIIPRLTREIFSRLTVSVIWTTNILTKQQIIFFSHLNCSWHLNDKEVTQKWCRRIK